MRVLSALQVRSLVARQSSLINAYNLKFRDLYSSGDFLL